MTGPSGRSRRSKYPCFGQLVDIIDSQLDTIIERAVREEVENMCLPLLFEIAEYELNAKERKLFEKLMHLSYRQLKEIFVQQPKKVETDAGHLTPSKLKGPETERLR